MPGAPAPDPTQVRQAVQSASAAAQQVSALHASVAGAEGRLRAARSLADQARELRRDGARTTKRELHAAADAGIKPDSRWKHFTDAVSKVWDAAVKVATVVAVANRNPPLGIGRRSSAVNGDPPRPSGAPGHRAMTTPRTVTYRDWNLGYGRPQKRPAYDEVEARRFAAGESFWVLFGDPDRPELVMAVERGGRVRACRTK